MTLRSRRIRTLLLCVLMAIESATVLAQEALAIAPPGAVTSPEDRAWRVHVVSVERRDTIFEYDKKPQRAVDGREFIRVAVRLEYLGPAARLRPPSDRDTGREVERSLR
jgi:hypothetical protein